MVDMPEPEPSEEERAQALRHPGGWIYRIAGSFGPDDAVPPERIIGAWAVGPDGRIVGAFIPNPRFRASAAGR